MLTLIRKNLTIFQSKFFLKSNTVYINRKYSDLDLGPDYVLPTHSFISTKLSEPVNLRYNYKNEELKRIKPMSFYTIFKERVQKTPNHIAMGNANHFLNRTVIFLNFKIVIKRNNEDIKYTYENYWNLCNQAAKSFIKLGLNPAHTVSILGFNSPEWMISLYGAIFAAYVLK